MENLQNFTNGQKQLEAPQITKRQIDENILEIFIPLTIRKRGGSAMLILTKYEQNNNDDKINKRVQNFDDKLLKALAKAYKWKTLLEDENNQKIKSLSDIARMEDISTSHATKVYRLNFISPKIIENIVNGTAPRDLRLQDIFANKAPEIWLEQEDMWGF